MDQTSESASAGRLAGVPPLDGRERDRLGARAAEAARRLAGEGIVAVALTWVDVGGITRVKTVPVERLEHAAATRSPPPARAPRTG